MPSRTSGGWYRDHSVVQLLRFATVGLSASMIYLLSTDLLHRYVALPVAVAASVSFVLVVAINYLLHYSWTFRSNQPHATAAPRFLGTAIGALALNYVTVALGTHYLPVPQPVVLVLGVCVVVVWNFVLSRLWVFVERSKPEPSAMRCRVGRR